MNSISDITTQVRKLTLVFIVQYTIKFDEELTIVSRWLTDSKHRICKSGTQYYEYEKNNLYHLLLCTNLIKNNILEIDA